MLPNQKKQKRDAMYKMHVDLTQAVKQGFSGVSEDDMMGLLGGYMKLMDPPEDAEEITMSPDEIRQTALLAAHSLSRQLYERSKQ